MEYGRKLLKFAVEVSRVMPDRTKQVFSLFRGVFEATKDVLASDLVAGQREHREPILWFLGFLGDTSVELLVSTLAKTEDPTLRKVILQILKTQPHSVEAIKEMLIPKTPGRELYRLLNVLEEFDYDFSENLYELFNFTSYANRIAIINYVYKRQTEKNIQWLMSLLDSEDTKVLEYVVDMITSLELKHAVPKLIKLLKTQNTELKRRICVALGVLREAEAIKPLKKLLFSKPRLFGLLKGEPLEVRLAACWALGNFVSLPEVKGLFLKLTKSKEKPLASSAKEVLGVKEEA